VSGGGGGRYSHRFTAPGTYEYYGSIHPKMTGKVVVTKAT
jgi:plastocyanin